MTDIVVAVKHVVSGTDGLSFTSHGTLDRQAADGQLSELDEYGVEQALRLKQSLPDATVTVLTVGPAAAIDAARKALQMGADKAVHVDDPRIAGSDALATSRVIAAALSKLPHDIVMFGMASTDAWLGVVPTMVAARLGLPLLARAAEVSVSGSRITVRQDSDGAVLRLEANLPVALSVTDQSGEPRYPSFKEIMAAKKKPCETWTLTDLGLDAVLVGAAGSRVAVTEAQPRPPRTSGEIVMDDAGAGAARLVEFLSAGKFI